MRYTLNNKGRRIGKVDANMNNIKKLPTSIKYTAASLLLSMGVLATVLATKPAKEVKEEKEFTQELINDNNYKNMYMIDQGSTILFVTDDYLYEHDYVALDDLETRYAFIVDANDKINAIKDKYGVVYKEYVDNNQEDSSLQQKYLFDLTDRIINYLRDHNIAFYVPDAITMAEYQRQNPYQEHKYEVNYTIEKDSTLSELLKYTDNKEEYRKTFDEVVERNEISNPDLIYAGDTITLTNVDQGDLHDMGYELYTTPRAEFDERYEWLDLNINDIFVLTGDINSRKTLEELMTQYRKFVIDSANYINNNDSESISDDLLYESRYLCDQISLLTGKMFEPTAKKVR